MIRLRARYARRSDDGVAMLFVIAIGMVVTALVIAMFSSVLQTSATARTQRNITSAQAAAEAGINDAVFKLSQYTNGVSNWSKYTQGASQWTQTTNPFTPAGGTFGSNASYSVWVTGPVAGSGNYILWSKGTYGSNSRTIRAEIAQGSPQAFDYSMFASKGIDIHHHSSYLSPLVWTTSVHSNGYINLDYSSEFTVNSMEAVGNILMAKGGGSTPSFNITAPYNWYDALSNKCFPGGMTKPAGADPTGTGSCVGDPKYSANATIYGTVNAGSITINSHGQVLPAAGGLLDTGQSIDTQPGNVYAGSATIGGTTYTTQTAANGCTACGKGASATAGQISGSLNIGSQYVPKTIAFPSIQLSNSVYHTNAAATGHLFTASGTFLNYITDPTKGLYRQINSQGQMVAWDGTSAPDVIYLNGDWDISGGAVTLNYGTIQNMVHAATGTNGPAPMIVVQGSLIVENGSLKLNAGLVMVGAGNNVDFLRKVSGQPISIDTSRSSTGLLDPAATMPAVLAVGGSIDSSDYDSDSNWTSSATYEPAKATPVYIRGLVYSASWNATTGTVVPENQHWHNFDPKNLQKIYGAQVGAQLHNCNNFSFSYDPLVKNAFGFGGGTVQIVDYQELGQ